MNSRFKRIALAYGGCYSLLTAVFFLVDYLGFTTDISFIASIFVSFSLISYIASIKCESSGYIVLLISMFVSLTLTIMQYILWAKFSNFVYNEMNAIMWPTLLALTVVDVLAMIWMYVNGNTRRDNERDIAMYNHSADGMAANKTGTIFITGDHSDV